MNELISELVGYGIEKGLVEEDDKIYVINRLLELFRLDSYTQTDKAIRQLSEILSDMTDYAAEHGLIPENTNVYRDLFDTKIMGILTPAPSVVRAKFTDLYVKNPKKATDFYYQFSQDTNYIRKDRVARDKKWKADTQYGKIDITINKGRGYVPADENREYCTDVNVIPIDSIYTPIRNVKYSVENFRVEQKTDYEKLVLEITTDGSIHPKDALKEAAKILIYHFMLFSDEKITLETSDIDGNEEFDEEILHMRQLLKTKLVDMDLSVRALNCLKAADVETLGDLVQFNKTDLLKFRNFGKKSLTELDDLLESLNLSFGTDISKYKLDKE